MPDSTSNGSPASLRLPTRTIRVFISSTFDDLKEERNALQEKVFPRLRRYCERLGWTFQAIDLRWGVSAEAALDQGTMRICLAEIARCQSVTPRPNFVILLGSRYGWRPLPSEIPAAEFDALLGAVPEESRGLLLWRDDQPVEHKGWYRLDQNADPPEFILQPRVGRFIDQEIWVREVEQPLGEALRRAARRAGFSEQHMLKYEASATEQEIDAGALAQPDAGEHVLAFFRELSPPHDADLDTCPPALRKYWDCTPEGALDEDAALRLATLKRRLRMHLCAHRVHSRDATWSKRGIGMDHIRWMCAIVYRNLRRTIRRQILRPQELSATREEQLRHDEFAFKRSRDFTGQAAAIQVITKYIEGENSRAPLVFYGPSGSGKSVLLAEAALECRGRRTAAICRFAGVTAESTQAASLLKGLCNEIDILYGKSASELPTDFDLLASEFQKRLELPSARRPLVLFIDALDQISAQNWNWLPQTLRPHTRIVLSSTPGSALERLRSRLPEQCFHVLDSMSPEDARVLLRKWLARAGRQLTPDQTLALFDGFAACKLPLYLRLAFEGARLWHSYDSSSPLPSSIDGMVERLFERLSEEKNHGRLLMSRVVGYLVSSRRGLTESEMLDLLAGDEDYWSDFSQRIVRHDLPSRRLPVVIWLRLYHDLSPYLSWRSLGGTTLMTFFHATFAAVADGWCPDGNWTSQMAHRRMGAYFQRAACPKRRGQWALGSRRALSELSYQRRSDIRQRYRQHLFGDVCFVAAAVGRGLLDELLEDLKAAEVPLMQEAVLSGLGGIRARPELAEVIAVNRLRNQKLPLALAAYLKRAEAELDRRGIWISAQTPLGQQRSVAGVISVTPLRGVFHALADGPTLEEYSLATYQLVGRRTLPSAANEHTLVIDSAKERIAWADPTGVYLEGERLPLKLRYPPHCLSFFGGLIGIDESHALVWYDLDRRTTCVLAKDIAPSFASIAFSADRRSAVLIDGDRSPTQRILLLRLEMGQARATEWLRPSFPVSSACLNETASVVVLATRSRQLKVYDLGTGSLLQEVSYRLASGLPARGIVQECCALTAEGRLHCLFGTNRGELLSWDTAKCEVRRRGLYSGLSESEVLRALEPIPEQEQFVVATANWIQTLSPDGEDLSASQSPITQCSYWPDGWLVLASAGAKSVTWFENNAWRNECVIHNEEPVTVAACGKGGATYVGYRNGVVARLAPGQTLDVEDALDLFDHSVCAVVPMENDRVLAVSERGEIKVAHFRPADVDRVIPHIENLRQEQFVCRLGDSGEFVSCGRCHSGDGRTSVIVVRNDGSRETVLKTPQLAVALAGGSDGTTVYVALEETVLRYCKQSGRWTNEGERKTSVEAMLGTADGTLAIVRREHGCRWLEIWSGSEDMQTLAATELPFASTSLAGAGSVIAIGAADGRHCLMEIHKQEQADEDLQAR
ncbi:MAG: DUF4062 domain-containing protein [Terriglobales bacterium]